MPPDISGSGLLTELLPVPNLLNPPEIPLEVPLEELLAAFTALVMGLDTEVLLPLLPAPSMLRPPAIPLEVPLDDGVDAGLLAVNTFDAVLVGLDVEPNLLNPPAIPLEVPLDELLDALTALVIGLDTVFAVLLELLLFELLLLLLELPPLLDMGISPSY